MKYEELQSLRMQAVFTDLPPDSPVPKYWENYVPPGISTAQNWLDHFGRLDESRAEESLMALVGVKVFTRWGQQVPALNIITNEPWNDWVERAVVNGAVHMRERPGARHRFSESIGTHSSPERPAYFRYAPVERIEVMEIPKLWEWPDGTIDKVLTRNFIAHGEPYDLPDDFNGPRPGQKGVVDSCRSGPERFEKDAKGKITQHGAATALLARLLEVATD